MIKAHQIRLNPTPEQETHFYKAAGTARYTYNWAVGQWHERAKVNPSGNVLKKDFNRIKPEWVFEVCKSVRDGAFMDFDKAVANYKSDRAKKPTFKSKNHGNFSFYVANDRIEVAGHGIKLRKLGWVNMVEKLRFHGKILNARIRKIGNHWYVSITVELTDKEVEPKQEACGVDVGILRLVTMSDGITVDNLRPLKTNLHRLAQLQRVLAGKQKGSKNYEKVKFKIREVHDRIRCIRDDLLHKLTTFIAKQYGLVAVEDLNVKGMTKNHRLAQSLQDASLGRLIRLLNYKVVDRHGKFVKVDRFFPSSKTCSCCGQINQQLTLRDRVYRCCSCNIEIDRDLNAAINILYEGLRIIFGNTMSGSGYDGHKKPPKTGNNLNLSSVLVGGVQVCIHSYT